MATQYEKYCINVRTFLPETIPLICEDCFNDWSHECERCDAIFEPYYNVPQPRVVKPSLSFASVLKGEIDETVVDEELTEFSIQDEQPEYLIQDETNCAYETHCVDEFSIQDENTEFSIQSLKTEFPEDLVPTVPKNEEFKTRYLGDDSRKEEISQEEPKKKKRKNKKKKRIATIIEEPDLKKQKIDDEIDNLPVIETPKRWYIDWLFSKKWDYFIGKPTKKKPLTYSFSMDYQIYTVILGLIAIGIHIWDKDFTHFSSKV